MYNYTLLSIMNGLTLYIYYNSTRLVHDTICDIIITVTECLDCEETVINKVRIVHHYTLSYIHNYNMNTTIDYREISRVNTAISM